MANAIPTSEKFNLDDVLYGLAADLSDLRQGKISNKDAKVRADVAKQIFNGVRLVVEGNRFLEYRSNLISVDSTPA